MVNCVLFCPPLVEKSELIAVCTRWSSALNLNHRCTDAQILLVQGSYRSWKSLEKFGKYVGNFQGLEKSGK